MELVIGWDGLILVSSFRLTLVMWSAPNSSTPSENRGVLCSGMNLFAAVLFHKQAFEYPIEIWIMDEFGVNGTWKILFSVEYDPRLVKPLAFWENDKLIMENKNGICAATTLVVKKFSSVIYTWSPSFSRGRRSA
ncbi:F-box CPR30-like protein [Melia azedarach]|uniref:F-box CPR30-like protein n=1 Tax=Melia azedarach TaxID=155640 RepID=A0ACC1X8G7_MELAZ|nr:F-box CPR30-like protein [Melia azedarach]